MSNYQQRDNTGSLFRNERKENEKHPDFNGSVLIDGVEYWQSAWVKEGKNGKKFFSQSFKRKDQNGDNRSKPAQARADISDEVPF